MLVISVGIGVFLIINDIPLIEKVRRYERELLLVRDAGPGNAHPGMIGGFFVYTTHVSEDGMVVYVTDYQLKSEMGLVYSPDNSYKKKRIMHLFGNWYKYYD
jgi:hypothetical protein